MAMDKDVKDSLVTSAGYQAVYNDLNIHEIWNLTEQVVVGSGAISVCSLFTRLLKQTQTGAYTKYENDLKDMVVDSRKRLTSIVFPCVKTIKVPS